MPAPHRVSTPAGRFDTAAVLAKLPRKAWQRMRTGHGTKGDRHYDWAMIEIIADDTPPGHEAGHSFLLSAATDTPANCPSTAATPPSPSRSPILSTWCAAAGGWKRTFRPRSRLTGLDQGQVTCWKSWIRWSLISLIAAALLAVATARHRAAALGEARAESAP